VISINNVIGYGMEKIRKFLMSFKLSGLFSDYPIEENLGYER
jgi:hypothetical protein